MGSIQSMNSFFIGLMYVVTMIMGGYFIAQREMQPQDLAIYAIYIGIFVSPIQILVELTEMLQKGFLDFVVFMKFYRFNPRFLTKRMHYL